MAAQPGLLSCPAPYEGRVRRLRKKRWIVSGIVFAIVLCSLGVHLFVNLDREYGEGEGQGERGIVGLKPPWQWEFPVVRATSLNTKTSQRSHSSHGVVITCGCYPTSSFVH